MRSFSGRVLPRRRTSGGVASTAATARVVFALVVAIAFAGGCVPPPKADLDVSKLEGSFPTIERLGVVAYEHSTFNSGEPVCDAITYRRGGFTSLPGSATCGAFDGVAAPIHSLDAQARGDLADLNAALAISHDGFRWIRIVYAENEIAVGSRFAVDGCITYAYDPGLTHPPSNIPRVSEVRAIVNKWFRVDDCP